MVKDEIGGKGRNSRGRTETCLALLIEIIVMCLEDFIVISWIKLHRTHSYCMCILYEQISTKQENTENKASSSNC